MGVVLTGSYSAKRLGNGEDILLCTELYDESQYITCYVMCDEIGQILWSSTVAKAQLTDLTAGTLRYAELKPGLPASAFPPKPRAISTADSGRARLNMNISRRRSRNDTANDSRYDQSRDEDGFFDDEIGDEDMLAAGKLDC